MKTALDQAKNTAAKIREVAKDTKHEGLEKLAVELNDRLLAIDQEGPGTKVEDYIPPGYQKRPPSTVDPNLDTGIERIRDPHTGEDLSKHGHKNEAKTQVHPAAQGEPKEEQGFNEDVTKKRKDEGLAGGKVHKSDQDRRP